jgi:outer membrane receptor protein involved in Fe transport
VVLAADDRPLAGAQVRLLGPNRLLLKETVTDDEGRFELTDVRPGTYELRVTAPPFRDRDQIITVGETPLDVRFRMVAAFIDETVTVSATRGILQDNTKVAASVRTLGVNELEERAADLLPRMLAEEPGVVTQQTTPGQGSPVLRGQSAQAVLYLFDGIRYNNSTYRGGNTQYLAWIPGVAVDAVEVLLGPAGVNYGSDALGGAINVASTSVPGYSRAGWDWSGSARVFGESTYLGGGGSATVGVAGQGFAAIAGGTAARHQDLRGGRGEDSHNSLIRFFGLTPEQVQDILGTRMQDTGYGHGGVTAKMSARVGKDGNLGGFFMYNEQNDVRRYDRLLGGDGRLIADFIPQKLGFGYVRYQEVFGETFFESTFSVNRQTDGRRSQTRPTSSLSEELNRVTSMGYAASASWSKGPHLLTLGGEVYDDFVTSSETETSRTGETQQVRPRYPNGTRYTSIGVFLLDEWGALKERLQVSGGLRFSSFHFRTNPDDNIIDGVPTVPDLSETFTDVTFHAGAVLFLNEESSVFGRVARGFRAPSVFDLGEQGLTGGGFEVTPSEAIRFDSFIGNGASVDATSTGVPWTPLDPEKLWSFEGGFRWRNDVTRFEFALFNSNMVDKLARRTMIVLQDVVGQTIGDEPIIFQDSEGRIYVPIDPRPVVSRANIGAERVWGIEGLFMRNLGTSWRLVVKGGMQRGHEQETDNWVRKLAPDNLTTSLRWSDVRGRLWLEGLVQVYAAQNRFNPFDYDDARIGAYRDAGTIAGFWNNAAMRLGLIEDGILTVTGETLDEVILRVLGPTLEGNSLFTETPGFVSVGVRGGVAINDTQSLTFGVMNVADSNYRLHGSGVDAPGINATVAYEANF